MMLVEGDTRGAREGVSLRGSHRGADLIVLLGKDRIRVGVTATNDNVFVVGSVEGIDVDVRVVDKYC